MSTFNRLAVASAGGLAVAALAAPAHAAVENGPLTFEAIDPGSRTMQIYRIGPGGGALRPLSQSESQGDWNECPSFTPSGLAVLYDNLNRAQDTLPQVWKRSNAGENPKRISKDENTFNSCPDASPNGKRIAYLSYPTSGYAQIGVMKRDGSDAKIVLSSKKAAFFNPQYSPDGTMLAVNKITYDKQGMNKRADVVLYNLKKGKQKNLTKGIDAQFGGNEWDPNGKGLVSVKGDTKLVRVFVNGAKPATVTSVSGQAYIASPVFAPTRSRIAYLVCTGGDCGDPDLAGTGAVWTVKKNGAKAKAILTGSPMTLLPGNKLDWGVQAQS